MRQSPVSLQEKLHLDHTSAVPLHRQIYQWVRRAILDGQLQPGQRLPLTRTMASELGISRNTASIAYEELQAEEFIERTVGSGTIVARFFSECPPPGRAATPSTEPALALSPFGRSLLARVRSVPTAFMRLPPPRPCAFRLGMPDLEQFPTALWATCWHARRVVPCQRTSTIRRALAIVRYVKPLRPISLSRVGYAARRIAC